MKTPLLYVVPLVGFLLSETLTYGATEVQTFNFDTYIPSTLSFDLTPFDPNLGDLQSVDISFTNLVVNGNITLTNNVYGPSTGSQPPSVIYNGGTQYTYFETSAAGYQPSFTQWHISGTSSDQSTGTAVFTFNYVPTVSLPPTSVVPEPKTYLLILSSILSLAFLKRFKRI